MITARVFGQKIRQVRKQQRITQAGLAAAAAAAGIGERFIREAEKRNMHNACCVIKNRMKSRALTNTLLGCDP